MEKKPTPKVLKTYGEGRLMIEAKGWPLEKAAAHLSEQSGLEGIHLSHPVLSRKSAKGGDIPLEPALAVAIEGMPAQRWHEARAAVVEAGLRAVHGEPPSVDVPRLAQDLREPLAQKLADTLTEKTEPGSFVDNVACGLADRLRVSRLVQELGERVDRLSLKRLLLVPAVVAALVGCLMLLLAPTPPGRTHASPATPLMFIIPGAGPDGSPVRFDPGSLLAMSAMGEKPLDQPIPVKTLPGQRVAPCDEGLGQEAIYGNCWAAQARVKPPCGRLFRRGDECYAPVAAEPTPNRPSAP